MYQFPTIQHIDQIREAIAAHRPDGDNEFFIADRDEFRVANYVVTLHDTFRDLDGTDEENLHRAILRECRGICFNREGKVIRRPFHKFFNYGEKSQEVPQGITLLKEDGSMIAPMILNGAIRYGTKMGITDITQHVETFTGNNPGYDALSREMIDAGYSPIFEFCARVNRVVLDHPITRMPLLAVRHMETGRYLPYGELVDLGKRHGVEVVQTYQDMAFEQLREVIRASEGIEGVIVRSEAGHMVKLKAESYLVIHRAKDNLTLEKNVLRMVALESVDDLIPMLPPEDSAKLEAYRDAIMANVLHFRRKVIEMARERLHLSKKDYAHWARTHSDVMAAQLFVARKAVDYEKDMEEEVMSSLLALMVKHTHTGPRVELLREIIGPVKWEYGLVE